MEKTIDIWFATSKSGQMCVYMDKPERDERFGIWRGRIYGLVTQFVSMMESNGLVLPDLKWKDEPVNGKITIEV